MNDPSIHQERSKCRRIEAEIAALERICGDDRARRELLWLRAKEKGDDWCVRDLERVDPDIPRRLAALEALLDPRDIETDRGRREAYGRLWNQCYEGHAGSTDHIPCDCTSCIKPRRRRARSRSPAR
jgi:hypothetical protein